MVSVLAPFGLQSWSYFKWYWKEFTNMIKMSLSPSTTWDISVWTKHWLIAMEFGTDIHDGQRINVNDFGDPVSSTTPSRSYFSHIQWNISTPTRWIDTQKKKIQAFIGSQSMYPNDLMIPEFSYSATMRWSYVVLSEMSHWYCQTFMFPQNALRQLWWCHSFFLYRQNCNRSNNLVHDQMSAKYSHNP